MGKPAAKKGDHITAVDTHLIQPPGPSSPIPVPHTHNSVLDNNLSTNVNIEGKPAATVGSIATNSPVHVPNGGSFVIPPQNKATVIQGSTSVFINKKQAARAGDKAMTCNDPAPLPNGTIVAFGRVNIGG